MKKCFKSILWHYIRNNWKSCATFPVSSNTGYIDYTQLQTYSKKLLNFRYHEIATISSFLR